MSKRKTARNPEGVDEGTGVNPQATEETKGRSATNQAKAAPRTRKEVVLRPCACGCGEQTKSAWAPGHDARLWAVGHKAKSGRLTPEAALEALALFPPETVKANGDRLNSLAELKLVS